MFDKNIERSFSQVIARGKYVHSIVLHDVKPDKVDEYVELVGQWYPRMAALEENKVNLVGSWRTQVGDNDTFGTIPTPFAYLPFQLTSFGFYSAHLGIPTIYRLSRVSPHDLPAPGVPRVR